MQKTVITKLLSLLIAVVLIAAMALLVTGCDSNKTDDAVSESSTPVSSVEESLSTTVGEGATSFDFIVEGLDGKQKAFIVKTDKATVGEALLDAKLIAGEDGDHGLYVKTVDGTTLDYDKDGKYWAFYVNGAYANSGVDSTNIVAGETYMFKAE